MVAITVELAVVVATTMLFIVVARTHMLDGHQDMLSGKSSAYNLHAEASLVWLMFSTAMIITTAMYGIWTLTVVWVFLTAIELFNLNEHFVWVGVTEDGERLGKVLLLLRRDHAEVVYTTSGRPAVGTTTSYQEDHFEPYRTLK